MNAGKSATIGDATLAIDEDGRVEASDGCANEFAPEIDGNRIGFEGFVTTGGCPDDRANDEANAFVRIFGENPSFTVEGTLLRLRTDADSGMDLKRT